MSKKSQAEEVLEQLEDIAVPYGVTVVPYSPGHGITLYRFFSAYAEDTSYRSEEVLHSYSLGADSAFLFLEGVKAGYERARGTLKEVPAIRRKFLPSESSYFVEERRRRNEVGY